MTVVASEFVTLLSTHARACVCRSESSTNGMEEALLRSDGVDAKKEIIGIFVETIEFSLHRLTSSTEVLKEARKGPHAYDPDRPAGKRLVIKRR